MQSKQNKLFKNINQILVPDWMPDQCLPRYEIDEGYSAISYKNNECIKLPLFKTHYDQISSWEYFFDIPLHKSSNLNSNDFDKILIKMLDYASYVNNSRFKSMKEAYVYLHLKDLVPAKICFNKNGSFKLEELHEWLEQNKQYSADIYHFDSISLNSLFIFPEPEFLGVLSLKNFNNFDEKEFEFGMAIMANVVAKVQLD